MCNLCEYDIALRCGTENPSGPLTSATQAKEYHIWAYVVFARIDKVIDTFFATPMYVFLTFIGIAAVKE